VYLTADDFTCLLVALCGAISRRWRYISAVGRETFRRDWKSANLYNVGIKIGMRFPKKWGNCFFAI